MALAFFSMQSGTQPGLMDAEQAAPSGIEQQVPEMPAPAPIPESDLPAIPAPATE